MGLTWAECDQGALRALLGRYAMVVSTVKDGDAIPGTFWGDSEAGLVGNTLYVRPDTPVHSALHEACHYICMDPERRGTLHTDAGGGYDEENGVCYLQVVLSDYLPGMGRARMFADMDAWGYSFRLGSSRAWFESDAADALQWLTERRVLDQDGSPTWSLVGDLPALPSGG